MVLCPHMQTGNLGTDRSFLLNALTMFVSAFTLFLIQPMMAKKLLPFFGGSASVWAVSLTVYTGLLFLGYGYTYLLSRLDTARQSQIHRWVIATLFLLASLPALARFSLIPPLEIILESHLSPYVLVLAVLLIAIGIPYFLLATTSPLLQRWYRGEDAYRLYAYSNAGSFAALISYPLVFERAFALSTHIRIAAVLTFAALGLTFFLARAHRSAETAHSRLPVSLAVRLQWIFFSALPAALLVAATNEATQTLSPIPLLWIIPLALYLLSFILAFAGRGTSGWVGATAFAFVFLSFDAGTSAYDTVSQFLIHFGLLFFVALFSHSRLFALRPDASDSPRFYFFLALGGMLGTLLTSLVAPLVFTDFIEYPFLVTIAALCIIVLFPGAKYVREEFHPSLRKVRVLAGALVLFVSSAYFAGHQDAGFLVSRNFYGVVKVTDWQGMRSMYHGETLHGAQFLDDAKKSHPNTYYDVGSGLEKALSTVRSREKRALNVGVLGLGTGSIAAHCTKGDSFVFYEIDPRIESLARSYFSFLQSCNGSAVRLGDGRLILEREARAGVLHDYDLIVVDAFSDDAIPTHLLTREAFRLYASRLKEDGLIAIHTSNKFLQLAPVAIMIGRDAGFSSRVVVSDGSMAPAGTPSQWVLFARDADLWDSATFASTSPTDSIDARLWTDEYVSIMETVNTGAVSR